MRKKVVLFDLDNTLTHRKQSIDAYALRFFSDFYEYIDPDMSAITIAQTIHLADNGGYLPSSSPFLSIKDAIAHQLLRSIQWQNTPQEDRLKQHWHEFFPKLAVPMSGLDTVLKYLKSNSFRIGVITNGGEHSQSLKLEALNILPYLDLVLISETAGAAKPDRQIFQQAIAQLQVETSQCYFVGDHPLNDILGSSRAGLTSVWLRGFHHWPSHQAPPSHSINQLTELEALIAAG